MLTTIWVKELIKGKDTPLNHGSFDVPFIPHKGDYVFLKMHVKGGMGRYEVISRYWTENFTACTLVVVFLDEVK